MIAAPPERLHAPYGRSIDRAHPLDFTFEGTRYAGYAGDTIASALWANGVKVLARSFKYKRPRGIFSLTGFDGGLLLQAGDEPNRAADRFALTAGLPPLFGQNYVGTLKHDREAGMGMFSRFLPVGFYYRSFFTPRGAWDFFEPLIRKHGGLGKLRPSHAHAPQTDKQYLFCDIAVVGSGPAGLAASLAAAQRGDDVLLIECESEIGGASRYSRPDETIARLIDDVRMHKNIRIITGAIAQGLYADNWLSVESDTRLYKVRAGRVIAATGTFEQPLIFRNNDLPGVMLASAALRLIWLYGVAPGRRAVICTSGEEGLQTALELLDAGVEVSAVADSRETRYEGSLHRRLRERGVAVTMQSTAYEALPAPAPFGRYFGAPLGGVRLGRIGSRGVEPAETISCDLLCVSGGFVPAAALLCHAGARLGFDDVQQTLAFGSLPPNADAAGSIRGLREIEAILADGRAAGERGTVRPQPSAGAPLPPLVAHAKGKEFVDLDEDLTLADIRNAIADGFTHVELLKRYSTSGMGPSQGKFSALPVLRAAAETLGSAPSSLGTTTARPPFTGQRVRLLAGKGFSPYRLTPMHQRHIDLGAQMMVAGTWYRPAYYGEPREQNEAIAREIRAVRTNVGLIDVSTLGGIEVSGPDAASFIDRIYATPHRKQPVGRTRYALLCDDGGSIVDDGVACRIGEQRFYLTATTSAVDQTYRKLLWLNAQWRMNVDILNVTSAFAAMNIAGPQARNVLSRIVDDIDLTSQGFPYLDIRIGRVAGIQARLMRVGFVGELGYEIHVPTPFGGALWDALIEAGRNERIVPFGVEAQRVLRLEKGHVIVGQDTDGLTHPDEAGLDWAVGTKKQEFIGRAAIAAQKANGITRRLIGFTLEDPKLSPPPECCLVIRDGVIAGRVTSSAKSEACGGVIGLAYVAAADSEPGSLISIKMPSGTRVRARVAQLPFYDVENARQQL